MPRGRNRKELVDFTYGMDSTSHPGLIADEISRFPLLQNVRISANGKCVRRNGHTIKTSGLDGTHAVVASGYDSGHFYSVNSAGKIYDLNTTTYGESQILDNADNEVTVNNARNVEINNGSVYIPNESSAGVIVDTATGTARAWGILGPEAAANVASGSGSNLIPAPSATSDTGWYYYYTYINKNTDGVLLSESHPSAQPSVRLTYSGSKVHLVDVVASDDPQVTHIRLYRTTGPNGYEDGTEPATAGYIGDYANTLATLTIDSTTPALMGLLLDTWTTYAYGDPVSPLPVTGRFCRIYKNMVMVFGTDNYVYYSQELVGEKYRECFDYRGFADFNDLVTGIFIYHNDIIICTLNKTWRIIDGDWSQRRLAVDGIGVVSNNSCAYDPTTDRVLALTNHGVMAWSGTTWSIDLAYQIKGDILAASNGVLDTTFLNSSTGVVVNREYYLSIYSSGDYNLTRIFVGFLNQNGTIAWSIDKIDDRVVVRGSFGLTSIGVLLGLARYGATEFSTVLLQFNDNESYDLTSTLIPMQIDTPWLIHGSTDNWVQLRYITVTGSIYNAWRTPGLVPYLKIFASTIGGQKSQTRKIINSVVIPTNRYSYSSAVTVINSVNAARFDTQQNNALTLGNYFTPALFDSHFDNVMGRDYIKTSIYYDGIKPLEINSIVMMYIWRDILKEVAIQE
jgi:hypothetical protein